MDAGPEKEVKTPLDSENDSTNRNEKSSQEYSTKHKNKNLDESPNLFRLHVTVVCLTISTAVLLVVILTVTILWSSRRNDNLTPREHVFCLDCKLLKGKKDPKNVTKEFQRHENECCGPASKIYKRLIDKATREKYEHELSNNFFANTECNGNESIPKKPSAKVAGISFMNMKQDQSSLNIVHWNKTGPLAFLGANVHYIEGKLQIDKPGHYYIFSQLKWSLNKSHTLPISHEMHLNSFQKGVYEVLLESRKTKCNLVDDTGEATSALGAVFKLDQGDKIFVTTSKPEALASCHHGNFFGLYHVAELQTKPVSVDGISK